MNNDYYVKNIIAARNELINLKVSFLVAGDVKAGKSTLINAIVGEEILPSSQLQATSAIVEIVKSIEYFAEVTFANGRKVKIYDDPSTPDVNEAKAYLQSVSCINDEYRGIPTTLIDEYILDHGMTNIDGLPLDEIAKKAKTKIGEKEKEKIKKFLNNRKPENIPVKIIFGFPTKLEFDEFHLLDSPGVNAVGGIQEKTLNFIETADSIIFVHPIQPIESKSFYNFFEKNSLNKKYVILVLTYSANCTDEEKTILLDEARRSFEGLIEPEKIFAVDSLLKLILFDLENGKTVQEIENSSDKKKHALAYFKQIARETEKNLVEVLREKSGFDELVKHIQAAVSLEIHQKTLKIIKNRVQKYTIL